MEGAVISIPSHIRMDRTIPELEKLYTDTLGFHDLPQTVFRRVSVRYIVEPATIVLTYAKKWKDQSDYTEFFWFHEAYHHYQYAFQGKNIINKVTDIASEEYLWQPIEREANVFAYRMCKENGLLVPDWMEEDGYFDGV